MADYKGIQGYMVQSLASDPSVADALGQLWYNSATNVWKVATSGPGAWSAGGDMTRPPSGLHEGGAGILTAGLAFGGTPWPYPPVDSTYTEEYDGTSWTAVTAMPTATHYNPGAGTQTAALSMGGNIQTTPQTFVFEYDGTNWTDGGDLPSATALSGALGTQTAAILIGGSPYTDVTVSYDGTSWTELATLTAARLALGGAGTTTAGLAFAGYTSGPPAGVLALTESWDGTSWTAVNVLNTARQTCGVGQGTQTDAMCVAGGTAPKAQTEIFDGTSWTEVGDLSTGRATVAQSSGTTDTATGWVAAGTPYTNITEEWANPIIAIKTVTTS